MGTIKAIISDGSTIDSKIQISPASVGGILFSRKLIGPISKNAIRLAAKITAITLIIVLTSSTASTINKIKAVHLNIFFTIINQNRRKHSSSRPAL